MYSIVISRPAMRFPNRARLTRAVSGGRQMVVYLRGAIRVYGAADEPSYPWASCLRKSDDLNARKV